MIGVGATVRLVGAQTPCRVTRLVGEGAQGRVYAVSVADSDGDVLREYALKWYRDGFATPAQRASLQRLLDRGSPGDRFLWPMDIAQVPTESSFGYVMPLRPTRFVPVADLLNGRVDPPVTVLADLCAELAETFLVLHSAGLCYRDINLGNVFFDPADGTPLVCDLDNVGVDGQGSAEIAGSPFFSAPEVVRGDRPSDSATDRFSLAVLLFLLLMLHHPLEGARALRYEALDLEAERDLFGLSPVFVFDPTDESNRPVPGIHDNALAFWPRFPTFLRELFTTAFTDGLHDPGKRITEGAWRRAMARLRDAVVLCPRCAAETFYDEVADAAVCWSCGHDIALPARLVVDSGASVFLSEGAFVTRHHVDRPFDRTPVGEVTAHPDDQRILGLRNLTAASWRARLGDDAYTPVPPERAIAIVDGLTIEFGPSRAAHVVAAGGEEPSV